jgi:hypothetical protein
MVPYSDEHVCTKKIVIMHRSGITKLGSLIRIVSKQCAAGELDQLYKKFVIRLHQIWEPNQSSMSNL